MRFSSNITYYVFALDPSISQKLLAEWLVQLVTSLPSNYKVLDWFKALPRLEHLCDFLFHQSPLTFPSFRGWWMSTSVWCELTSDGLDLVQSAVPDLHSSIAINFFRVVTGTPTITCYIKDKSECKAQTFKLRNKNSVGWAIHEE